MTEFAISTNLISWVPAKKGGIFGWPQDGAEAEVVESMQPGDLLIPKFAQNPDYRRAGSQADYVQGICDVLELDYEHEFADYEDRVAWGAGAIPFVWTVKRSLGGDDRFPSEEPWSCVEIQQAELRYPLSTRRVPAPAHDLDRAGAPVQGNCGTEPSHPGRSGRHRRRNCRIRAPAPAGSAGAAVLGPGEG